MTSKLRDNVYDKRKRISLLDSNCVPKDDLMLEHYPNSGSNFLEGQASAIKPIACRH